MKTIKHKLSIFIFLVFGQVAVSQTEGVSIKNSPGAPHASAMLDVDCINKGVLVPRVILTSTTSISPVAVTPADGLLVYNTFSNAAVSPGFYYWGGGVWNKIMANASPEIWKRETTNPNKVYYNAGASSSTVTVGTGTTGVSTTSLFVFGPSKFNSGGCGTGSAPVNDGIFIGGPCTSQGGHWNEINVKTTVLDLQWNTGTGVNIGAASAPGSTNLWVNGLVTPTSDSTVKKNYTPLTEVLNDLTQIRGYQFNFKFENNNDPKHIGVLAQEIETKFPQLVREIDRNKDPAASPDMIKTVDYSGLTAVLLQAIKELKARVEYLETR